MTRCTYILVVALSIACTSEDELTYFTAEEAMDPQSCESCHTAHYQEWAGSMHAYAAEDPVFIAMNARGQRESNGELGDFCVQCHAPLALRLGLTEDGTDLDEVPQHLKGVTCYFCHTVESVEGAHNAPIKLSKEIVMRGAFSDPIDNPAHLSGYSPLLDRRRLESSTLCGSCHDIVSPQGVHLEATFAEWQSTIFAHDTPREKQTCGQCHMRGETAPIADFPGVPERRRKNHMMVGVDVAITDFPDMENQKANVEAMLDGSLLQRVCVYPDGQTQKTVIATCLENISAGHSFPSGATQDRRVWVEVVAYDADDNVVFESGVVGPKEPVSKHYDDPNLQWFGQRCYDKEGEEVHMFWQAASCQGTLLPGPTALSPLDPDFVDTHVCKERQLDIELPARVVAKVHVRPMGLDIIDDLIESGDLAPEFRDKIPTFTLAKHATVEWKVEDSKICFPAE